MSEIEQLIRSIVRDELARAKPANDSEHLTVAEYAQRWNVSPSTVRAAIRDNRLEVTRIGKVIRIAAGARIARAAKDDEDERVRLMLMRGGR